MNELWPRSRNGLPAQMVHVSYEKAGLVIADQPIPWNAEAVVIEASLRLPPSASRRRGDFTLHHSALHNLPADLLQQQKQDSLYRLLFRIPTPTASVVVDLRYRDRLLGQVRLPYLSREEFLGGLRLQMPTVSVRLQGESVACRTFVSVQSQGLLASVLITSPTSLAPLVDRELEVELQQDGGKTIGRAVARLSSTQLMARQALLTVVPGKLPRRLGQWSLVWRLGERELARQELSSISRSHFQRSLRLSDSRFIVHNKGMPPRLFRHLPPLDECQRIGPCFILCSGEVGMAGVCSLSIHAQIPGAVAGPVLFEQDVVITDGPTLVTPGTFNRQELEQVSGFDLRLAGKFLAHLSLQPAPTAVFNAEGGFATMPEYKWTAAVEEEMNERLNRLLEGL